MRKVVYIGSEPVASKLLFAPISQEPEDTCNLDGLEMTEGPSSPHGREQANTNSGSRDGGVSSSKVEA
jgi:hypothetical protein